MPQQELFFQNETTGRRVEVLKTYDQQFARESFASMDEPAQAQLWDALKIEDSYDPADIPRRLDPDSGDFLWDELLEAAREEGNILSFFVVNESTGSGRKPLYVSPDWPSAEAYAKNRIAAVQ